MKTILLSGGHLTPALAVIDQAKKEKRDLQFVFLGREFSQEGTQQISQEKKEIESREIPFIATTAPKFHKRYWWKNALEITKWLPSLSTAWRTISQHQPDVLLTFGGYLAFPIALVCRVRGIPVITHEQTTEAGMANTVISFLSVKIAVAHPSSLEHFPKHKTIVTGNPIRPRLLGKIPTKPRWVIETDRPILFITGGNQGSEIINTVVGQLLPSLTTKWYVIHQCGNPLSGLNYQQRLEDIANTLTTVQRKHYVVKPWLKEEEMTWIFDQAQVVVARSGANTSLELIIHQTPSVLIPLPFSHNNEQYKNAEILEKAGSAVILPQSRLNPDTLYETIQVVNRKHRAMSRKAGLLRDEMILDGSSRLLNVVEEVLKHTKQLVEKE